MKALQAALSFLTRLLLITAIFARDEEFQVDDPPFQHGNDADAGFVWLGAVRTISVQGDTSFCGNICNVYLNRTTEDLFHTTHRIRPQIVFTGLKPGQYTISHICRPTTAKLHCLIEPGILDFEVDDEISDSLLDGIDLGTLHARVEEMASPGRSDWPAVSAIIFVQAIGLLLISEALKRKIAESL
ncbi:uncharacterized protein LOC131079547 isoform X2 [Cryptomeria japonica]|nr:uncharacterized protein LOC131079547 isoform X2 [Cryptomeria japonica]XP_057873511.2 uncharacterized protein LOC131079547 isoform X2 [Cryptomeria japonica]XP_057873512.2 uncharacterized protein LOC131079547 isoform X2 [Cryptomeria japonica]